MTKHTARRYLFWYLGLTFAMSYAVEIAIIGRGRAPDDEWLYVPLMWTPGLVALAMKVVLRRKLEAFGWRWPGRRWLGLACAAPFALAFLAYGVAWTTGLVPFALPPRDKPLGLLVLFVELPINLVLGPLVGIPFAALLALGEEIGWRGLMVPLLFRAEFPRPLLLSGITWGLFHAPLILFGNYATSQLPLVSLLFFVGLCIGASVLMGWMRLASLSLWPAVLLHASHNYFFQSVFARFSPSTEWSAFWVGESGILPVCCYGGVALWLWRSGRLSAVRRVLVSASTVEDALEVAREHPE